MQQSRPPGGPPCACWWVGGAACSAPWVAVPPPHNKRLHAKHPIRKGSPHSAARSAQHCPGSPAAPSKGTTAHLAVRQVEAEAGQRIHLQQRFIEAAAGLSGRLSPALSGWEGAHRHLAGAWSQPSLPCSQGPLQAGAPAGSYRHVRLLLHRPLRPLNVCVFLRGRGRGRRGGGSPFAHCRPLRSLRPPHAWPRPSDRGAAGSRLVLPPGRPALLCHVPGPLCMLH